MSVVVLFVRVCLVLAALWAWAGPPSWPASRVPAAAAAAADTTIRPSFGPADPHWKDTAGHRIEAHGGGLLQHGDAWYWYGESRKTGSLEDHGVTCYSAPSLAGPWMFVGLVMSQAAIVGPSLDGHKGPFVIERPKVLHNNATQMFVMWFHLDDAGYNYRRAGVATARSAAGPFTFTRALQPDGIPSLDMNLWRDPLDGQAYFVRSCDNAYAGISRLTPDFLNTTGIINKHSRFEGMAFFRLPNGTYYLITSHLTGWEPNPLMLFRAQGKTLDDPQWVSMGNPTGDATSFNTQPTYVVPVVAEKTGEPFYMYMADNWVHGGPEGLVDAAYIWLPFWFEDGGSIVLKRQTAWDLRDPFAARQAPTGSSTKHEKPYSLFL